MSELTNTLPLIKSCLGKNDKFCNDNESKNLLAIRKGLVAARDIKIGKVIERNDLMYARPATEIDSSQINKLLGKKSTTNITKGIMLSFNMFN